jgi:hypothetical protein
VSSHLLVIDDGDCGAIGGMRIGRGNRSTRRKLVLALLCPTQMPLDLTEARTWAAAVGSRRLHASAMALPRGRERERERGGSVLSIVAAVRLHFRMTRLPDRGMLQPDIRGPAHASEPSALV